MEIGFAKTDITPRVGVELCGFGPFINRHSVGVRDRLWARAMAVRSEDEEAVLVSCDLVGVTRETTRSVRRKVQQEAGLSGGTVIISCSHTHSGPNTSGLRIGWGAYDPPYMEVLPHRIASACVEALENMRPAEVSHAEVPCEGIGLNREYDKDAPPLEDVLEEDWRPAHPELTDTTCHVLRVDGEDGLLGFASYFSCHPVVCCADNRFIHGDYCGVATNMLEREHPGSVGLFLQGAQGDVNSCVVHKPEKESLLALDVIASRYARSVRRGISEAQPIGAEPFSCDVKEVKFTREDVSEGNLRERLAEENAILQQEEASDEDRDVRMATVRAVAIRRVLEVIEREGRFPVPPTELAAFRLGEVMLLCSPFETFQAIKSDVQENARSPIPLVLGLVNDSVGYAPDRKAAERGGYAADVVPLIHGDLPYANAHDELVEGLLKLEREVLESGQVGES